MHIRKLELQGFKSFPDRTTFHFARGISGVVGPNGCGKSNVVDSVKWCLGEQSARSLRGKSMEDIIFAGSVARPGMGLAEVTLTFAAGEEPFPGELARCDEVQVSRRLFRDGHSEYLINQQRVRLRDVQDLFLDTGAANRLYSFIEQGRIGQIVNARPEQRRSLIEEAAGISRYKARAQESESKLVETQRNLERATDVVENLASRLRSLKRQVGKAVRYRRYRTRIRQVEIALGIVRFAGLIADRKALLGLVGEARREEQQLERAVGRREDEIKRAREALDVLDTAVGRTRDRLAELEATRREQESARQYQDREKRQLESRVGALDADRLRADGERTDAAARLATSSAELELALAELERHDGRLQALRASLQQAESALRDRRSRIDRGKADVLQQVKSMARLRAERDAALARRDELGSRADELASQQSEVGVDLAGLEAAAGVAKQDATASEAAVELARAALPPAQEALSAARAKVAGAERELRQLESDVRDAERALARSRARLDSLVSLQSSHHGVGDDLKGALAVPGTLGSLAEHLDVSKEIEPVLAVALGPLLDAVLVPDAATAAAVAKVARGRVSCVVLDGPTPPTAPWVGAVGGTDAGVAALARALGGADQADDIDQALALARTSGRPVVVCPPSDAGRPALVGPTGVVRLGVGSGGGRAILARRREISALEVETAAQQTAVDGLAAKATGLRDGLMGARAQVEAAQDALQVVRESASEAELAARESQRVLAERQREAARQATRVERMATEAGRLAESRAQASTRARELDERIEAAGTVLSKAESALHTHQAALADDERTAASARDALAGTASTVAGLRERRVGLERAVREATAAEAGAATRVERGTAELATARARIAELVADDGRLAAQLQEIGTVQSELRARLEQERAKVKEERDDLLKREEVLRTTRERREKASSRRAELERRMDQVKGDIVQVRDQLDERHELNAAGVLDRMDRTGFFAISPDDGAVDPEIEGVEANDGGLEIEEIRLTPSMFDDGDLVRGWVAQLKSDREALARLGEVNLVALQEYTEVLARHAALEQQRADLDTSVASIRRTVAKLNKLCRERFRDTFDQVNGYFKETYPRLVGGGRAELLLTNEDDLLETGVEIVVQPPGKRLQNLTLLSGGETAMVALALIFSLFRVKPSPFCLLDEVDAPLDEGNGARFNSMLREMSELSQFIVITHNKKTMECADTLYGVTMVAPGVSRLVTVQLD